jgi:hypothetical protein
MTTVTRGNKKGNVSSGGNNNNNGSKESEEFVTVTKSHPVDAATKIKYVRSMFTGNNLAIIDLLLFGLSRNNPTLSSAFTKRFVSKYFWWERLNIELQSDPNYE